MAQRPVPAPVAENASRPARVHSAKRPHVVVLSTLYPTPARPQAGVFVHTRMSRVARYLPVTVVAPVPWFPLQALLRLWRPQFRPAAPRTQVLDGLTVYHPRFFCIPALGKRWDAWFMALGCRPLLKRLQGRGELDLIDAHFGYPEGAAARYLARWLGVPYTVTLRGTEPRAARTPALRGRLAPALGEAAHVFAVADSLRRIADEMGVPPERSSVVGNAVDAARFRPLPRSAARRALGLAEAAPVLISVGGLVERKGFHRVIACLPALRAQFPALQYLIVGEAGPEGDYSDALQRQVAALGLQDAVHFLGPIPHARLAEVLAAADVFVLATRNEGWANVFLEAMACGLPVVTTDVGGNAEVVCDARLGSVVPFGDAAALEQALAQALRADWDRDAIVAHARTQSWPRRVRALVRTFAAITRARATRREARA